MKRPTWRHEVVTFAEIAETEAFQARARFRPEEARSLRHHPLAQPGAPVAILLLRDGETVGSLKVLPGRLRIGAAEFPLAWTSSWEYEGGTEGAGAGLLLVRALEAAGSLASCGVSARARSILHYARFAELRLRRFATVLDPRAAMTARVGGARIGVALRSLAPVLFAPFALARRAAVGRTRAAYRLEPTARFDGLVEEIDQAARGPYWFPRDHRELNWALEWPWSPAPGYRYRPFYLRSGRTAVGYALARLRRDARGITVGSLLRSAVVPTAERAREAIIALVMDALADDGAHVFELATSDVRLAVAARAAGMRQRGELQLMWRLGAEPTSALSHAGARIDDFEAELGEGDLLLF